MPDRLSINQARSLAGAEIRQLLDERSGRVIIGITGPPGTGKSTFAERLADDFNAGRAGCASYLPMDGFHLSNAQLDRLGRRDRKGAPDTFDVAGYLATLERVAHEYRGHDVYVPDFDRVLDEPVAAGRVVPAESRLIITEGNYLALSTGGWHPVRQLIDRLFYLDCPSVVLRLRLIERHTAGGRSHDAAVHWVDSVDELNARLISGTRRICDTTLLIDDPGD